MVTMFKNFESFIYSSKENFPKDMCIIQNQNEPDVFDAENIYQVIYIDIRFPKEKMITYAKPYIYKDCNGDTSFGWVSIYTSEIFGNVENSCQFYNEYVIGFILTDNSYIKDDEELFEKFKQTIEKQFNA